MESPSQTKRRSTRIIEASSTAVKMTPRRSPFIPTTFESILLSIYPTTLLLGSIFSILSPDVRASEYNAALQSHPPSTAPSYFAKKSNIFNQWFVKKGWAWISASYFFFLLTHPSTGPPGVPTLTPRRLRGFLRYAVVTTWWVFITQWFFGPPIIDRGFIMTGGQCDMVDAAEKGKVDMDNTRQFLTGVACKAVGGKWKGGHDISGHVFLLVLGSMFLFQEVLHVVLRSSGMKEERTIVMGDGAIKSADVEAPPQNEAEGLNQDGWLGLSVRIILGVAGLSLFMLAMTAMYFHTWFEKLTGLIVAFGGVFVVFWLPRLNPTVRSVLGMPGI
ncbi:hypothetical protein EAF04_000786 [Stromatinia cepivora]|nr:hypothetical protein EAF04_000786 [Stromatinia cepivora]